MLSFLLHPVLPSGFFPSGFPTKNPKYAFLFSLTVSHILWATYPAHFIFFDFITLIIFTCQSQWLRSLRSRSAATRLLRSCVRIPPVAWMFVCCECCVSSGRGLCDELITHPEESYRMCCVVVCELETSRMSRPWPTLGRSVTAQKKRLISDFNIIL